ncbi:hypothetical protein K435DRAFT_801994 [Dendrothele bispora CBS 962.96]|uniref:Uncharacterized protein n=1 Tax=Dendrothele bispora (strain CBS 962.96) TaxID=1314807 RepID=A0A4S8LNC7_DENBC|nr:hypothetical protein K435DRAFT_801994 [Dendrothele bispora CBS 962.96]
MSDNRSFAVSGIINEMYIQEGRSDSDEESSTWLIIQLGPDPANITSFMNVLHMLDSTLYNALFPRPWYLGGNNEPYILITYPPTLTAISTADNVTIPPPPTADFINYASYYRHWDNERKAITLDASLTVDCPIVYEEVDDNTLIPCVVAECVNVLGNVLLFVVFPARYFALIIVDGISIQMKIHIFRFRIKATVALIYGIKNYQGGENVLE